MSYASGKTIKGQQMIKRRMDVKEMTIWGSFRIWADRDWEGNNGTRVNLNLAPILLGISAVIIISEIILSFNAFNGLIISKRRPDGYYYISLSDFLYSFIDKKNF
ncbi:uncharacterized protein OCT59_011910 [Rhizophagus irregularis]|uniref:uncharacterized protein n=1 Tax=Rhizophagus irregularis TaxID=588596 RepID=UPI003327471B|nr:hypothetical protein OCT59_011910 [Rhizophagus irregularis]